MNASNLLYSTIPDIKTIRPHVEPVGLLPHGESRLGC